MSSDIECDKLADAFLVLGTQYYAIARYAAVSFLSPVCGTLYHHAIELLLKGCLVCTLNTGQLKRLGHNLQALWNELKAQEKDSELSSLDHHISQLDQFEEIRYPERLIDDDFIAEIRLQSGGTPLSHSVLDKPAKYQLNVEDLDGLVAAVFHVSPHPPRCYFTFLPDNLKMGIPRNLFE